MKKKYIFNVPKKEKLDELLQTDLNEYATMNNAVDEYSLYAFSSSEGPGTYCPTYPGSGAEEC